jgi:hypothetical protein
MHPRVYKKTGPWGGGGGVQQTTATYAYYVNNLFSETVIDTWQQCCHVTDANFCCDIYY